MIGRKEGFIRARSPDGTWPPKTSASVPRLMPLKSALTTTSSVRGSGSASVRISPRPGAAIQNDLASSGMHRHSYAVLAPLQ
jgi:hypothetical protein